LFLDVDDLLDPLEMRRQRTSVALARSITCPTCFDVGRGLRCGDRRLDIFEPELKLVDLELLRAGAEAMAHERVEHRPEPGDLGISVVGASGLLENQPAQHLDIIGKVGLDQHESR